MKNIWKIFTGDLKKLVKQPFALVIIIGLCVIPSQKAGAESFCAGDRDRSLYHTFVVCVV